MKNVVIIGAGPAGLTAAYELLKDGGKEKYNVTVLEESDCIGGISKTVNYKGNRMDMGGHRFFSKVPEVNAWWDQMLPMQGAKSKDDLMLEREIPLVAGGPDPEQTDEAMLVRHRVSRIFFDDKFYDYPISLKGKTLKNMGFGNTMKVGFSYLGAMIKKKPETNLENFYINRFGRKLYSMFFEYYTENLWGRHPSEIDASWGAQRVKGLSIRAVLKDVFGKAFKKKNRKVETSLIEEFKYPKLGPGELWEVTAEKVKELGGTILMNARAEGIHKTGTEACVIDSVQYEQEGTHYTKECDILISSMPVKDLVAGMNDVPEDMAKIAAGLPYRDYMTLGVLVSKIKLKNETDMKTVGDIAPDCWVYVQDRRVKMGRFQLYNNWSPYLVKDLENTVWIGLEYFCNEGDEFWNQTEEEFSKLAIEEMVKIGLIEKTEDVLDSHMEKVKKAYPAYFDTYDHMDELVEYLSSIENLYCVGRNGQHRYNNIDHSMCTSFEAAKNIENGIKDKSNIWSVNTEKEYHEVEKKEKIKDYPC
ncbi:MAG: NAD(P)/FAD-dependent oxidoreductase [Lachnospiraceae bacterium]|nr:NAD(P)/FAD-dependent oxidoreductase [Lachnospiraceae bacterium]